MLQDAAGHEYAVTGDPEGTLRFNHQQGDNDLGFQGTCGLCSVQDVLNQFGIDVNENSVVHFANDHHLCSADGPPDACGGTSIFTQAEILNDYQIHAQPFQGGTLEQLAHEFEQGHKVIIETNAGELFQGILLDSTCAQVVGPDPHAYNHAVVITGVVRDPQTGAIVGMFINDTGANLGAQFVPAANLEQAWIGTGGQGVVADGGPPTPDAAPQPGPNDQAQPPMQPPPGYTTPAVTPQTLNPQPLTSSPQSAPQALPTPQTLNPHPGPQATPGPLTLPQIAPRPAAPADQTPQEASGGGGTLPLIALPLVAMAALRAHKSRS